jgi:subtilisin family serine protease
MSTVYAIHTEEDRPFVEKQLIRALPALGFDRWISSGMLTPGTRGPESMQSAMKGTAATLAVVPASASVTQAFCDEVQAALSGRTPVIPVYRGKRNTEPADPLLAMLQRAGGVDASGAGGDSRAPGWWHALADLLPSAASSGPGGDSTDNAQRIEWNEEVFSGFLAAAVARHDYSRADSMLTCLTDHIAHRGYPYPQNHARTDLKALRRKRQFLLMRRYAEAALKSGTQDFQVRRQYAQALIELKNFERAIEVLTGLVADATAAKDDERYEARGLIGRLLKQKYVDAAHRAEANSLTQAIEAYWSVFREDEQHIWHGINAATCILRANRDGVAAPAPAEARGIATKVLEAVDKRRAALESNEKALDVWDCATQVEALVDVEAFDKALTALDQYLTHPDMDAFEVSSTYRQFDEVLQLADDPRAGPLIDRLARTAELLRSGGITAIDDRGTRAMLVRVSDPGWSGGGIPGLVVHTQLGTVMSITGSADTVKALLKDPLVIGFEESRPSGPVECARSLPFIRVADTYEGAGASFSERGDAALIAMIDDGIDVLHEAFLDADGKSRVVGIWDQQDADLPASPPAGFDFGRYHSAADIAGYVAQKKVPASLSRANLGHGTHVASIAAGRKAGAFAGGVAPEAQLLIVISGGDEPTGYSHAHLAALKFIDAKATELGKPVVVNVSQGMNAGAHDGRSALEVAFDEFAKGGRVPGRIVVKSAGNERDKRGHASVPVAAGGAENLTWRCPTGTSRVRLELWWHSANHYKFQLKSPSGDLSEWVDRKSPDLEGYFKKRGPFAIKLVTLHPDNGDNMLKIEVDNGVSPIAASDWTLRIDAVAVPAPGGIHAWIERGSAAQAPTEFVNHGTEELTLSIPGTSNSVITVGAIDANTPIFVGAFSSYGPTRDGRKKPDVSAPGVNVNAARRDTVNGVMALDGTSMAAPHVTGAIALVLSKTARAGVTCPAATQVGAVLRQKTRNYSAQWDPGQGYGVLDVAALLGAF